MQDTPDAPEGAAPAPVAAPKVSQRILAQYIRDLSFENVLARKGATGDVTPEIAVQVSLDGRKRSGIDNQYEVTTKLTATSKGKATGDVLFVVELEYVGVFQIEGVPENQIHPYLLIECPRITFPFVRRIVSDVTRDGGFPPLNLEMIDFVALYRNEIARRVQANQPAAAPRLDA
ncbi:protein-export chaperone SecB [Rubellimicrobium aerolatum]|uniref:Protein-export protein SecB n=1 Tax=Rubellimicrobium aerolatum TaxID=490979 RepID=A0ABW0SA28_9RHOB|nr:protein-export chaperone SecB [Rubellimicrobium aerolatum]MBP1805143.1 preprotein translocase subunit SecB [Rubellimicrobium aerolatum]